MNHDYELEKQAHPENYCLHKVTVVRMVEGEPEVYCEHCGVYLYNLLEEPLWDTEEVYI